MSAKQTNLLFIGYPKCAAMLIILFLSKQKLFNVLLHRVLAAEAYHHLWRAVLRYEHDCRNRAYPECLSQVLAFVHIYLIDIDLAFVLYCKLFENRGQLLTWAAP